FVIDHLIGAHQCERRLMVEILPLAAHLLRRRGEQSHRLAAAVAPAWASGDPPVGAFQGPLGLAIPAGMTDARALRQRGEHLDAEINPSPLSGGRQGAHWRLRARATDTPAVRLFADRDHLGYAFDGPGPAHGNPPTRR